MSISHYIKYYCIFLIIFKMNPIQERIKQYIKFKGLSTRAFELSCGLSFGYIANMRQSIQPDKALNIANHYPDLNMGWILTGEGQMLKSESSTEDLANRLSEIITDLEYEPLKGVAKSLGLNDEIELGCFTNNFIWPKRPFDFVKFLNEYPEFNLRWIMTGEGDKFVRDETECKKAIKDKILHKNHSELFPEEHNNDLELSERDSYLWKQILSQNEQLREKDAQIKEKDAQINQLLNILQEKTH